VSPPLAVRGVSAAYRDEAVLWDVSFTIPEGRLVGIVGPNGAGKTTMLKVAMGLLRPVAGSVEIFGRPIDRVRQSVGYVPQRGSVDWDFPTDARDVVEMGTYGRLGWLRRPGTAERRTAERCLERVDMLGLADRQIGELSGGQQQRVFIARALAQDARLYLADEPFAGVDYVTERLVVDLLRELRDEGRTVVVVHHDLASVADYFDTVVLLNRELVAAGPTAEVFTRENIARTYGGAARRAEEMRTDG
jgi:manganese/zinc/iron transport system ATP- binding protein